MNSRGLRGKIPAAALVLFYIVINIWILCLLHQLKDYEDLLSLSYPAGGITDTGFAEWKKTDGGKRAETAAVWKSCGKSTISSESTGHQETVCCYQMQGQPEAVFGKTLAAGRYFIKEEEGICLLDRETVRSLFGSEDVLGLEVKLNEKTLQLAGILNENSPICIIPAEKGTAFDGIAVHRKDAGESVKLAVSLMEAVLGGAHGQVIDGKLYYITACMLYAVMTAAILLAAGKAAGSIAGNNKRGSRRSGRYVFYLFIGMAAAALAAGIKAADPGSDYLPPYWSDFDFFGRLFEEKAGQIQQLLAHQEFSSWQRMAELWRQAVQLEILSVILSAAASVFLRGGQECGRMSALNKMIKGDIYEEKKNPDTNYIMHSSCGIFHSGMRRRRKTGGTKGAEDGENRHTGNRQR